MVKISQQDLRFHLGGNPNPQEGRVAEEPRRRPGQFVVDVADELRGEGIIIPGTTRITEWFCEGKTKRPTAVEKEKGRGEITVMKQKRKEI